ncbi:MAG TPA: ABC transporter substrate-binding protein [Burkholderiaceae bacterium]|jgi:phospholipid transport system substrate-binding protein|nr:ABC transporter substrate-binding protein [Burkholderiaceae bacterium]
MFQRTISTLLFAAATLVASSAYAQAAPDAMIKGVSDDVISTVKSDKSIPASVQSGDLSHLQALVDTKVLPHVDLARMTAGVMGRYWKQATPDQQQKIQAQFKTLLIHTYAGALTRVNEGTTVVIKPLRADPGDTEVTVHSEIRGAGDPVTIDYRLEKQGDWKVYDVNVLGVWLVDQYKGSFAQVIASNGIDGLISQLEAKNKGPVPAKS